VSSSFRRPYTEVGSLLYVLIEMLSTTSTTLFLQCQNALALELQEEES
jgi:hypothetical protein